MKNYSAYMDKYLTELNDNVMDFWLKYGPDKENGGIYTCFDRQGNLYCTDKAVWLIGRCAWMCAYLCDYVGYKDEYKALSKNCLDFLEAHCIDKKDGRMYFTVTAEGAPLRKRRYFFSETFYIIGCAQYAKSFNEPAYLEKARKYYNFLMDIYQGRIADPYKITPKVLPETRQTTAYAEPMILLNVSHIMAECDPENKAFYYEKAKELTDKIFKCFYKPELKALLEVTGTNGEFLKDIYGGRTMNPGHSIEGVWFMVTQYKNTGDEDVLKKAEDVYHWAMERGWDKEQGGMLAFVDVLGYPAEALEHDMKLWWPTCETIISSLMLYEVTGKEEYWDNFVMADEYAYSHFADKAGGGEWYGYLHKDGTPSLTLKGNLFKGPFHVPRMLSMAYLTLGRIKEKYGE